MGVQQECPLSSFLFLCVMEPLFEKIRSDWVMNGVPVPKRDGDQAKCVAYMNNFNVICQDHLSVERVLRHTGEYVKMAGDKLNIPKSTHMVCGDAGDLSTLEVKIVKERWVLGIDFDPGLEGQTTWRKVSSKVM